MPDRRAGRYGGRFGGESGHHPDKKLTLTEKSSQTVSRARDLAAGPRHAETTITSKVYRYVSDFGYLILWISRWTAWIGNFGAAEMKSQ